MKGKLKLLRLEDCEEASIKDIITLNNRMYFCSIVTYDGMILVNPMQIPQYLINKVREEKIREGSVIEVVVDYNNNLVIDENDKAIVEIIKGQIHDVSTYTSQQVAFIIDDLEDKLNIKFYKDGISRTARKEFVKNYLTNINLNKEP